ncbi:MAG: C25 family cysteine peptidase, partial [Chloroflexota bacterium]
GDGSGQLTVRIWSNNQAANDPDHHVELILNGRSLADHFWDGIQSQTIHLELDPGSLRPADNTLTIRAPGDTGAAGEALYIDWIHLTYQSRLTLGQEQLAFTSEAAVTTIEGGGRELLFFDVTNPADPVWLTGAVIEQDEATLATAAGEFVALPPDEASPPEISPVPQWPDALKDSDQGADYLAIVASVEGFAETLQPLLDFRQQEGLRVRSAPLAQVYDEFGYGRQDPAAIRDFLAYAQANWQPPAPRFVLLVGDSSYDLNGFTDSPNQELLPTYLVYTEFAGYVASDTWFTMLDGDSLAPNLAIGRFPAQTVRQLETMVNKTLAYEQATGSEWLDRALLVADDESSFNVASDQLAGRLETADFAIQKLYMTEDEEIHDEIISALNQGVGILNYVGHGSIDVWGDERVLKAEDTTNFFNRERLPIFTTFTCLNGYFNHPEVNSLAESLLWTPDGGVVAAVVPSGRSLPTQQLPLADTFYQSLLEGQVATLGEALQMAKAAAAGDDFFADVIHTFNLLGDPALRFHLP